MFAPLALLVVSLVLCAGVQAQIQNGTVNATYDDTDHRISWLPSVCNTTIKSNTTAGLCNGTWTVSDSKGMPNYASYFNNTAHITNTTGASCTVHFRGSSIYWFSTVSPDGGLVNVVLDTQPAVLISLAQTPALYRIPVYGAQYLDPSLKHNLTLTKMGGGPVNIDFFSVLVPPNTTFPTQTGAASFTWHFGPTASLSQSGSSSSITLSSLPSSTLFVLYAFTLGFAIVFGFFVIR